MVMQRLLIENCDRRREMDDGIKVWTSSQAYSGHTEQRKIRAHAKRPSVCGVEKRRKENKTCWVDEHSSTSSQTYYEHKGPRQSRARAKCPSSGYNLMAGYPHGYNLFLPYTRQWLWRLLIENYDRRREMDEGIKDMLGGRALERTLGTQNNAKVEHMQNALQFVASRNGGRKTRHVGWTSTQAYDGYTEQRQSRAHAKRPSVCGKSQVIWANVSQFVG
nr:hypothetical protein [Tanacetum cinerariifolium]